MARKQSDGELFAPANIGVKEISTSQLKANPHNPRMLFDEAPLAVLQESIAKVGILVPLTVYRESRSGSYVILDGQRRWICAQNLGLKKVPVNQVDEPTLVQNIVTMFQIHKLREDWELMPTALKLELLMNELDERNERKLAALTGLDAAVVSRCKKLLSYPKKYQDKMLDPDPSKRVKADFFIELHAVRNDRLVAKMDWFNKNKFTEAMLDRYQGGGLRSVTDFRVIKQHINNARKASQVKQISGRLRAFTNDSRLGIDHLKIEAASVTAEARELHRQLQKLVTELQDLDVGAFYGEDELWDALEELIIAARRVLVKADRRVRP